jgi:GNAT superfamily N-acetyltransferase
VNLLLAPYDPARLDELVTMWRASFEAGVGVRDPHPIGEQRQFFLDRVLPQQTVRLAIADGELAGFVAADAVSIGQLYVKAGLWGRGIGAAMLAWAQGQSGGSLWLYTFARNGGACRFYERHGFVACERGFEPMWQLEDVKYRWPC